MRQETFSATEIETKKSEGWSIVQENVIGGKLRSALMQKSGDRFEYVDAETKAANAYRASLSPRLRKMHDRNASLKHRGYDL